MALLTACGASGAAPTAMHNVLAYDKLVGNCDRRPGCESQIWVAKPNGTHAKFLTVGDQPSVSPDGRYVAFIRDWSNPEKVLVMPTAGGAAKTVGTGSAGQLVWAPNSRFLAFYDFGRDRGMVFDIETGKQFTTLDSSDFAFSPDSQQIAFAGAGVTVVPTRGGTPVELTHSLEDSNTVWGKPGIAFFAPTSSGDGYGDIWLTSPRQSNARQLTHGGVGALPAAFSADGTKLLAYSLDRPDGHIGRLWAVDVPSGRTRALTGWRDVYPIGLSRNGRIVLARAHCSGTRSDVETIPFAGGKPHVIVRGTCNASWNR